MEAGILTCDLGLMAFGYIFGANIKLWHIASNEISAFAPSVID